VVIFDHLAACCAVPPSPETLASWGNDRALLDVLYRRSESTAAAEHAAEPVAEPSAFTV